MKKITMKNHGIYLLVTANGRNIKHTKWCEKNEAINMIINIPEHASLKAKFPKSFITTSNK